MATSLKHLIRDQKKKRADKRQKSINLLEEAQEDINSAIRKIRKALKGTNRESYCEVYLIGHLENWANSESSGDTTIPDLMEEFYNEEIE